MCARAYRVSHLSAEHKEISESAFVGARALAIYFATQRLAASTRRPKEAAAKKTFYFSAASHR